MPIDKIKLYDDIRITRDLVSGDDYKIRITRDLVSGDDYES
jgi:hypothetical protein